MKRRATIFGLFLLLAGVTAAYWSVPLRRPDAWVRQELLHATPLGSTVVAVGEYVAAQRLADVAHGETQTGQPEPWITACIGSYSLPRQTMVVGRWRFDAAGRLRDIEILREGPQPKERSR